MKGHVLIGGGYGFIGQRLTKTLRNSGFGVTTISRKPKKDDLSWNDVQILGLPAHTTAVVNLAGQNILDMKHRWNEEFQKLVWTSRIDSTALLAKCIAEGQGTISSFVIMSGVAIYEPSKNVYDEDSRVKNYDFFSDMCINLEQVSKTPSEKNCRQVVIRSGVVLGREGGMIKQLYLPFYFGLGGPVLPGSQYLPWIHIKDLCKLIMYSVETPSVSGVLNGVAPQQITNDEFAKAFGKALSRPAFMPLPKQILEFLLQDRAKMLTTGPRVHPKRALALGFKYTYPNIESACDEVVNPISDPVF